MADVTPLHFVISAEEKRFIEAFRNSGTTLDRFVSDVVSSGKTMDSTFQRVGESAKAIFRGESFSQSDLSENINAQKTAIKGLENELITVRDKMRDLFKRKDASPANLAEFERLKKYLVDIRSELRDDKKTLSEMEAAFKKAFESGDKGSLTYLTQMRQIRVEMAQLVREHGAMGAQALPRYQELEKKLMEIGTAMRVVTTQQRALTTGATQMSGIISGLQGISGAFTAAHGVAALFTKDQEKLAAIQTKLQAAMSITMGISAAQNALHATSAFRITTMRKVTELWTAAQKFLNVQLGLSTVLSRALMFSGIGLLIAAISGIIMALKNWTKEQEGSIKARQEALRSIQAEISTVKTLESILNDSSESYKSRTEALKKLKEIMPDYNAQLDKEGQLIKDNTDALKKYIEQLKNAAMAKTYIEKLAKAESNFNEWANNLSRRQQDVLLTNGHGLKYEDIDLYNALNAKRNALVKEIKKYEKLAEQTQSKAFEEKTPPTEGSKAFWEEQLKEAKSAIEAMTEAEKGSEKWNNAVAKAKEATEKLKTWDLNETSSNGQKQLDAAQRLSDDELKIKNEMIRLLIEADQKRLDLEKDSFDKRLKQNDLNSRKEQQSIEEQKQKMLKELQDAERDKWKSTGSKGTFKPTITELPKDRAAQIEGMYRAEAAAHKKGQQEIYDEIEKKEEAEILLYGTKLEKKIYELKQYYEKEMQLAQGQQELLAKLDENFIKDTQKAMRELGPEKSMNEFFIEYGNMFEKILAITKEYAEKINEAEDEWQKKSLQKEADDRIRAVKLENIKKGDLWNDYFKDIEKRSKKSIQDQINTFKTIIAYGKKQTKELPEELKTAWSFIGDESDKSKETLIGLVEHVKNLESELDKIKNVSPFRKLAKAFDELKNSVKGSAQETSALNNAMDAIKDINSIVSTIGNAFKGLNEELDRTIEDLTNSVDTIISLAGAGAQIGGAWGAVAGAALGVVASIGQILIKDHKEAIERSKKAEQAYFESVNYQIQKEINLLKELNGLTLKDVGPLAKKSKEMVEKEQKEILKKVNDKTRNIFPLGLLNATGYVRVGELTVKDAVKLKEVEERWKLLPADVKEYINSLIELEETLEEIARIEKEQFTGMSFDELKSSLDSLVTSMDLTFSDIGKSFEDTMSKSMLNMVKKGLMDSELKAWYDKFAAYMEAGDLTPEQVEELRRSYEEIVKKANDDYNKSMEIIGKTGEERAGMKGLAQQMTQDQATEMNGFLNNGLILWRDIRDSSKWTAEMLSSVGDGMSLYRGIQERMLGELRQINENTAYCENLAGMRADMRNMSNVLDGFERRGITLRN